MPNYDYVSKKDTRVIQNRQAACFGSIFHSINRISRISILVFPQGIKKKDGKYGKKPNYGWNRDGVTTRILPKYNTPGKLGVERWAEFLGAFIPNTSFMLDYDEVTSQSICQQDVRISEFRLEDSNEHPISDLFKQLWVNGVRYSWENDGPKMAGFCLHYWRPEMKPYEAFQIFLLSHAITDQRAHACRAQNPKFYNEEMYQKLLVEKHDPSLGTSILSNGNFLRDQKTYEFIINDLVKKVQEASTNILEKKESPKLEEILALWK